MKKKLLIFIFLFLVKWSYGQTYEIILDIDAVIAISNNFAVQGAALEQYSSTQKSIAKYNELIAEKLGQVYLSKYKLIKALTDVGAIKSNIREFETIENIVSYIGKYQNLMLSYSEKNPALAIFAVKAELELASRTLGIFDYVTTAITGDDTNLLDNYDRMSILENVIKELRIMRGIAYHIVSMMQTAQIYGIWAAYTGNYSFNRQKIKDFVLNNYNSKRTKQ